MAPGADLPDPLHGDVVQDARWWAVEDLARVNLAFDHGIVLDAAIERARAKLEYTTWPRRSCRPSSPSPSCGRSTRRSGARRWTPGTSTARPRARPASWSSWSVTPPPPAAARDRKSVV